MIEFQKVTKRFGKIKALQGVDLTCRKGECIALIGPNGCGKTTLIKTLLGMVYPDSGTISFDGKEIEKSISYRSQIGYMPQIGRYPDNMTVAQVFDLLKTLRKDKKSVLDEDLILEFELKNRLNQRISQLSGGTRQKVSASLAFLFNPGVLVLDEPTAGLDPVSSEILKSKIRKEMEKGKLTLITSHILSELDDLITQVVFMEDGKIRFHKNLTDLYESTGETKLSKAIATILTRDLV